MLTWIVIAVIIVISGLIAYLGDMVGHKVGKKKLTLFGLRPRYTSIIITILTGILIAVISVTIIMGVSRNVRMAVFNIQDVLSELAVLTIQLRTRDMQLSEMREEIKETEQELDSIKGQQTLLRDELDVITEEYNMALRELEAARQEIAQLEEDKEKLYKTIGTQEDEMVVLEEQREEMEAKSGELEEKISLLQAAYELMEKEYNQRYQELGRLYYLLGQRYQEYIAGDILYLRGEEIHRDVIEGAREEEEILQKLENFLEEANRLASNRGVKPVSEDTDRSIIFYTDELMAVAKELYQREGRFIIRLVAEANTIQGQQLRARFQVAPDYIIYQEGDIIMSRVIAPDLSPYELEEELGVLFRSLRETALQDGILPDMSGQIGSVDFVVFYNLLEELKGYSETVEIVINANEDIWRVDSLTDNIDFLVQPVTPRTDEEDKETSTIETEEIKTDEAEEKVEKEEDEKGDIEAEEIPEQDAENDSGS